MEDVSVRVTFFGRFGLLQRVGGLFCTVKEVLIVTQARHLKKDNVTVC